MTYILKNSSIAEYKKHLALEEKSKSTIEKYMRDIQNFYAYLSEDKNIDKEKVIHFKESLLENRAVSTANSAIAALNGLFSFLGWDELKVKPFKQQRRIFPILSYAVFKARDLRIDHAPEQRYC